MSQKIAIFRCDASHKIGGGHVMRCHALAKILSEYGWKVVLATKEETFKTIPLANEYFSDACMLPSELELEITVLKKDWSEGCDLLVVDHYNLDKSFESELKGWAKKILVIDDLADREHECDIFLDPTPDRAFKDYKKVLPDKTTLLSGPQYALIDKRFLEKRSSSLDKREIDSPIKKILISVGASDATGLLLKILSAMNQLDSSCEFDVVTGSNSHLKNEVLRFIEMHNMHGNIIGVTNEMAILMSKADLAVGASGHSIWERCCLGLPSIIITTAGNQNLIAESINNKKAGLFIGDSESVKEQHIANSIQELISNNAMRKEISSKSAQLCDGRGVLRTYLAIGNPFFTKDGHPVYFRLVDNNDSELIYMWQIHPDTRRYASDQSDITREQHENWMKKTTSNPDIYFLMIICNGNPSGTIRLDKTEIENVIEISIYVSPDMYRLGVGKTALSLLLETFSTITFGAKVLPENIASTKLFKNMGFKKVKDNYYMNIPAFNNLH